MSTVGGNGKYGKQKQRQEDRDHKSALASLDRVERWWPDPEIETEESVETAYEDDWQISQRTVVYKNTSQIVEFAVTFSRHTGDDEWAEVLCIDTCNHQSVHRHRDGNHSKLEDIEFISDQDIVQNQYWEAVGEAYALAYGEG
ncbi:hypothetical protein [Microbacterium maritypicum]|uniref:hypothetical protein n=1 Tax=Microbacterium maritypicum TaxID=33918 RepID=UPI003800BD87